MSSGAATAAAAQPALQVPVKVYSFLEQLMRKKDIQHLTGYARNIRRRRSKDLTHLVVLGIGSVVGAGIFVITGQAASRFAGPSLTLSFLITALPCFLTGICYSEVLSMLPIIGSAYSCAGLALGEAATWFVVMCLAFEKLVGAAAVAVGCSATLRTFLSEFGIMIPPPLARAPFVVVDDRIVSTEAVFNLPAMLIVLFATTLLSLRAMERNHANDVAVTMKLTVLLAFVGFGVYYAIVYPHKFDGNLTPYIPENLGDFGHYGWSGIFRGAGVVFFASSGLDAICSSPQECINAQRDLPRALMITIVTCTCLYICVTTVLTGLVPYQRLGVDSPVVAALVYVDADPLFRVVMELGVIARLLFLCLSSLMAMSRLMRTVAQDGLLPPWMAKMHPGTNTPVHATISAGLVASFIAGFLPLTMLLELVSFGTLLAFIAIALSSLRLRHTHALQFRAYVAPFFPWIPCIAIASCLVHLCFLPLRTWRNYGICSLVCGTFYIFYGRRHSKLSDRHHADVMREEDIRIDELPGESELLHRYLVVEAATAIPNRDGTHHAVPLSTSSPPTTAALP